MQVLYRISLWAAVHWHDKPGLMLWIPGRLARLQTGMLVQPAIPESSAAEAQGAQPYCDEDEPDSFFFDCERAHAGVATAAPGNGQILPAPAAIADAMAATGDADMAAAAAEPRDGLVDASEPTSPGDRCKPPHSHR